MEKLLTVKAVAERLAVHQNTIYRWIEKGHLRAYRLGGGEQGRLRIEEREAERMLANTSSLST